jgi:hypothetical protein
VAKKLKLTPPSKRTPNFTPLEIQEQSIIFAWAHGVPAHQEFGRWIPAQPPICKLVGIDMLYATMNGLRLTVGQAVKASRAGMRQGPLDINLDVARGGYFGLRIELKRVKGGVLSEEQALWMERLRQEGYRAECARGSRDAIAIITAYLHAPKTVCIPFATEQE